MNYITLNNGTKIPAAGIGTFMMEPADAEAASLSAIQQGYEMIDTANAYMNEKAVGRAVKASGKAREDLYISTKLWPSVYKTADEAIDETLARIDMDYIDLLFLHQPVGDYVGAYKAMEQAVKDGKVKSLGLSNFSKEQVEEIIEKCEIRPAVLQVEAHPYYPQNELKEAFPDIHLMAWYPLGHGDKALQQEPIFATLAEKYNKSTAQIILRWHTQVGNIVIPGSKNSAHIKDNIDIFDITLTDEELNEIAKLNNGKAYYKATKAALLGYLAYRPNFDKQD